MVTPNLESKATELLLSEGFDSALPGFSSLSVLHASSMRVRVVGFWYQLSQVAGGISIHNLSKIGHMVSKCAWQLQEHNEGSDVQIQNNLTYVHQRNPKAGDVAVFFVGKAHRTAFLRHHLSFRIYIRVHSREVLIGMGTSSLTVLPEAPFLIEAAQDTETVLPGHPEINGARPASESPALPPLLAQINDGEGKKFMMVNVETSMPYNMSDVMEKLGAMRVKPRNIKFESLPIKKRHRVVYYFEIWDDDEAKMLTSLSNTKHWSNHFDLDKISLDGQEPFIFEALSMPQIIETFFLGKKFRWQSIQDPWNSPLDRLERRLNDKKFLGDAVRDVTMMKETLDKLNGTGARIFRSKVKPAAII